MPPRGNSTRCIGLLRAVNLGGVNQVAMSALRDLFTRLGFDDPRTLLQSGNVVFGATSGAPMGWKRSSRLRSSISRKWNTVRKLDSVATS